MMVLSDLFDVVVILAVALLTFLVVNMGVAWLRMVQRTKANAYLAQREQQNSAIHLARGFDQKAAKGFKVDHDASKER